MFIKSFQKRCREFSTESFVRNKAKKDESQNARYKETKHTKFSEKRPPVSIRACTHQVVKKVSFLENWVTFFLVTPVWRFSHLIYCRQFFLYTVFYCCFSVASGECTWTI